jgi:pyruvate dehydrogenase E2 component (dihydrolipoamide acetyltransferase)
VTIEASSVRASPAAKRRARELNVSLATIKGTGEGGAISIEDVEKAVGRAPRRDMRGAIAALMERSKREIPHYYLAYDIDVTKALAWLEALNERVDVSERILPAALFLKAIAVAARAVPAMNGSYTRDRFEPSANVHLGVAVSLREGGLLVPAIHDVDKQTLREVMSALSDVVERARRGMLRGSELTDATLTVTNLGEAGADTVFGVIFPPQVAIVGLGRVIERPAAVEDKVAIRSFVTATVSADHRASDGHLGARFLAAIERALQAPEAL